MPWSEACCGGTLFVNYSNEMMMMMMMTTMMMMMMMMLASSYNNLTFFFGSFDAFTHRTIAHQGGANAGTSSTLACHMRKKQVPLSFGFVAGPRWTPNHWEEYNTCFSFRYAQVQSHDIAKQLVYRHVSICFIWNFTVQFVFCLLCSTSTCPMSPAKPAKHGSWWFLMLWFWS